MTLSCQVESENSSKPKSVNSWNHVASSVFDPFEQIFKKICENYTAMQFEFDSFMSCCDDSSNPKSLITAWFSLLFFLPLLAATVIWNLEFHSEIIDLGPKLFLAGPKMFRLYQNLLDIHWWKQFSVPVQKSGVEKLGN